MTSVGIYSRKGLENWSKNAEEHFQSLGYKTSRFSEHFEEDCFDFNSSFNKFIHENKSKISTYNDEENKDIIQRCRLLRSLDRSIAISMISSAQRAIIEYINKEKIEVFIAPRVDSYILDIIDRELSSRNQLFIGVWRSAFLKRKFFLTKRGEVNQINHEISSKDCEELINSLSNLEFKATSITNSNNFTAFQFLRRYLYLLLRDIFFEFTRYFTKYRYGYHELTNRFHTISDRIKIGDFFKAMENKNHYLEPLKSGNRAKNIFIALQVNPESTIDYYSPNIEFTNIEKTLDLLTSNLSKNGYNIFIKDHPNMFGRRMFHRLKKIFNYENVFYVPYSVISTEVIKNCDIVFSWSGTVNMQSFLSNKIAISVCPPYSVEHPSFITLQDISDIQNINHLINQAKKSTIDYDHKFTLAKKILSSLKDGEVFTSNNQKGDAGQFVSYIDNYITNKLF